MRYLIFLLFFLFTWNISFAQKIPRIKQQPQWAMPFYFEDANGAKDTVWIGYDSTASIFQENFDPDFEIWHILDTSQFAAFTNVNLNGNQKTKIKKIEVVSDISHNIISIKFIKGKMPVTMKWEDSLFYSRKLPFPDLFPRPRGRGDMDCYNAEPPYLYCNTGTPYSPIVLTDYVVSGFRFYAKDSFVFDGLGNVPATRAVALNIQIVPHNFGLVGINEKFEKRVNIYPNPVLNTLNVNTDLIKEYNFSIISIQGKEIKKGKIKSHFLKTEIDVSNIPQGIYILRLNSNMLNSNYTFIKL